MKTDFDKLFRLEMEKLSKQGQSPNRDLKPKPNKHDERSRVKRNKELDRPSGQQIDRYI